MRTWFESIQYYFIQNLYKVVVFSLILLSILFTAYFNRRVIFGDEVHYLTVTSSIINDQDFILDNNYNNADYFPYLGVRVSPHASPDTNGNLKPNHGILPSIIAIPGYWSQGKTGVRFTLLFISIAFLYILYEFLKYIGISKHISIATIALLGSSTPILLYSSILVPDLLYGYFTLLACFLLLKCTTPHTYTQYALHFLSGSILGLGIYLHFKTILLSFFISIAYIAIIYNKERSILENIRLHWGKLATFGISYLFWFILASLINVKWFNTLRPDGLLVNDLRGEQIPNGILQANPLETITGGIFDIERGLFWFAPGLLLLLCGFLVWRKNHKQSFTLIALPTFIYTCIIMSYSDWTGGFGPATRYLLFAIPLIAPSAAYFISSLQKNSIKILFTITAVGMNLIFTSAFFVSGQYGFPGFNGFNDQLYIFLRELTIENTIYSLATYLNFQNDSILRTVLSLVIIISLVGINILTIYYSRLLLFLTNNKYIFSKR